MDPRKAIRALKDPTMLRKMQQVRNRRKIQQTKEDEYVPVPKIELIQSDPFLTNYSAEENYRAYKLFAIMDTNAGGSITLREIKRVLTGDTDTTLTARFDHPDTGILWMLDGDNCVAIDRCEQFSPASYNPFLIHGLRIVSINDLPIPQRDPNAFTILYNEILRLHDEPCVFEFIEPPIIISQFSCMLDIEVGGNEYSVELPIGAHYNLENFVEYASNALIKCHSSFRFLKFSIDIECRQVSFSSDKFPFRLLFASGTNNPRSCRYALGFANEDTPILQRHDGQKMLIDLNLGISREMLDILLNELFVSFDRDGSGEFEFEEFRNFYVYFLDKPESLTKLRAYAQYRFRDIEKENEAKERIAIKEELRERKKKSRDINLAKRAAQKAKGFKNSYVDENGFRRRIRARDDQLKNILDQVKTADAPKTESEIFNDAIASYLDRKTGAALEEAMKKDAEEKAEKLRIDALMAEDAEKQRDKMDRILVERRERRREEKKRAKKQEERRKKVMQTILEANKKLLVDERNSSKKVKDQEMILQMIEVQQALQRGIKSAMSITSTEIKGRNLFELNMQKIIATPALKAGANIFGAEFDVKQLDLVDVPSSIMNPGVTGYFLIREPKEDNYTVRESIIKNPKFDATIKHPTFFTADYERKSSRHSSLALGVVSSISRQREVGEKYRRDHGIELKNSPPPEEAIPPKATKMKKVDFVPTTSLKRDRLVARATVISLIVTDLSPVHAVELNSPFVSMSCGDWQASTEVNAFAGSQSAWDELFWVFRLHANTDLKVTVSSGSVIRNRVIGTAIVSAEDLVSQPVSKTGDMEFFVTIYEPDSKSHRATGHISIKFFMELGDEYDWYAFKYNRDLIEKRKIRKLKKRLLLKTMADTPPPLTFPLNLRISEIRIFELESVHLLVSNSPYVVLDCGRFSQRTAVKEFAGSETDWKDLDWRLTLTSERSNIICIVNSGTANLGRFAINGVNLAALPRSRTGRLHIAGNLTTSKGQTGKITINCQIEVPPKYSDSRFELSQSTFSSTSFILDSPTNSIKLSSLFPARVQLLGVAVMDLLPVHSLRANSPFVNIKCGVWEKHTVALDLAGSDGHWELIPEWEFPMTERLRIVATVISEAVEVGSVTIEALELARLERNPGGYTEFVGHITNGVNVSGSIKLILLIEPENEASLSIFFPDEMQPLVQPDLSPSLSGYGSMTFNVDSVANPKIEVRPNKVLYLPNSSIGSLPSNFPFRMTISSIILVDLTSVHFFKGNSPHINAACGPWAAVSPVISNAGSSATWSGLSWSFFVHSKTSLRLTSWSFDKVIGTVELSANELLECAAEKTGMCEIFRNVMDGNRIRGKLKLIFLKESPDLGSDVDPFAYKTEAVIIEPPLLATIYTIAVMDLKSVHPFSKNQPFLKAGCGKWKGSTTVKEGAGSNAKWENILWSVTMRDISELIISVLSGSVVIGSIKFRPHDLTSKPMDKFGLTEVEGFILDGNHQDPTGKFRMVCRIEPHLEDFDESDADDDDLDYEFDGKGSILGLPKTYIPIIFEVRVLGISVYNLLFEGLSFHTPCVNLECNKWSSKTKPQFVTGNAVKWTDLTWKFEMRRKQLLRIVVNSGSKNLGITSFTTRDLFDGPKDDAGHFFISKSLTNDGFYSGDIKLQLSIEAMENAEDVDEELDEALFFYDPLSVPFDPSLKVNIPFSVRITEILLLDLVPLHYIGTNSPSVEIICGDKRLRTKAWYLAGGHAKWEDLQWAFIILDEKTTIQINVYSGKKSGGSVILNATDILGVPRTKDGISLLTGTFMKGHTSYGRVQIRSYLGNYVSEEEKERLRKLAEEMEKPPKLMAKLCILSMALESMTQIYGLFKNSPRIMLKIGKYENTTTVAWSAGDHAVWENLSWVNIPVFERAELFFRVFSGNESLGMISLTALEIQSLPKDEFGYTTIFGDLVDGNVYKGKIRVHAKIDDASDDDEHSMMTSVDSLKSMTFNDDHNDLHSHFDSFEGEERIIPLHNSLSLATPTPLMTKAYVVSLEAWNLKSVHSFGKNSPQVRFECGSWKSQTRAIQNAGSEVKWEALSIPFIMKKMTFVKLSVSSKSIFIGSVSISTREMLEVPKNSDGLVILSRSIEDDTEVTGQLRIGLRVIAQFGSLEDDDKSFATASIATPVNLELPFTMTISKIRILDLVSAHSLTQNSPSVHVAFGTWKKRTAAISRAGRNAEWPNLDWSIDVFDENQILQVSVLSGSIQVGKLTLTIAELVSIPANEVGVIEISGILMKEDSLRGRVVIFATLRPYVSRESKEEIAKSKLGSGEETLNSPRLLARVSFLLITAIEISTMIPELRLRAKLGAWSKVTESKSNRAGMFAWGNLDGWYDVSLKERALLSISASYGKRKIGTFTISAAEIMQLTPDGDGCIVLFGDILGEDSLRKGKISLSCKIEFSHNINSISESHYCDVLTSTQKPSIETHAQSNATLVDIGLASPNQILDIPKAAKIGVLCISAADLRGVHKAGKNSPMVRLECGTSRFRTKSIPFGGNEGSWTDLMWSFEMRQKAYVRLAVVSNSVTIGSTTLSTREMWNAPMLQDSNLRILKGIPIRHDTKGVGPLAEVCGTLSFSFEISDNSKTEYSSSAASPTEMEMGNTLHKSQAQLQLQFDTPPKRPSTSRGGLDDNTSCPSTQRTIFSTSQYSPRSESTMTGRSDSSSDSFPLSGSSGETSDFSDIISEVEDDKSRCSDESMLSQLSPTMTSRTDDYSYSDRSDYDEDDRDSCEDLSDGPEDIRDDHLVNDSTIETPDYIQANRWIEAINDFSDHRQVTSIIAPKAPKSQDLDDKKFFFTNDLKWLHHSSSLEEIAHFIAVDNVKILLHGVIQSFVALKCGGGYLKKEPFIDHINEVSTQSYCRHFLKLEKEMAFLKVREIIETCGTKLMRRLPVLQKQDEFKPLDVENKMSVADTQLHEFSSKKRAGVFMASAGTDYNSQMSNLQTAVSVSEQFDLYKSSVPGLGPVPMRARITFLDIIGFDISCIDRRVLPKRPYLTACKPYGNWAQETRPIWMSDRNLAKTDMVLSWYNLPETEGWDSCPMRLGQVFVIDFHDGGSGLVFAKIMLPYEFILNQKRDDGDYIAMFIKMDIANEYGGGTTSGVVRLHADLSINIWKRPRKSEEYWTQPRSHHWQTFPLTPIATGVVRQKFGDIARDYDNQKIIHPAFFGFSVRYRGHQVDESRFIHPMFTGFSLARKPKNKLETEAIRRSIQLLSDPNPFKWDPIAASKGKCPVCGDGAPGCPRCFMLPRRKDLSPTTPEDFAFDPEKEKKEAAARASKEYEESAKAAIKERRRKNLLAAGRLAEVEELERDESEDSSDEDETHTNQRSLKSSGSSKRNDEGEEEVEEIIPFHTKLTTFDALRFYRSTVMNLISVYVKVFPAGNIKRLVVDPTWTTFHLYNMFNSNSDIGTMSLSKFVVPTNNGLLEIDSSIFAGDEFQLPENTGRDTLSRYGLRQRGSTIVLLFFRTYTREMAPILLRNWFEKNTKKSLGILPVYDILPTGIVPDNLRRDFVQVSMRPIILTNFESQLLEERQRYKQMYVDYKLSDDAARKAAMLAKKFAKQREEQEIRAAARRLESQLSRIPDLEEREKMRKILEERESMKRGRVSEEEKKMTEKRKEDYLKRMEKLKRRKQRRRENFQRKLAGLDPINEDDDDATEVPKATSVVNDNSVEVDVGIEAPMMHDPNISPHHPNDVALEDGDDDSSSASENYSDEDSYFNSSDSEEEEDDDDDDDYESDDDLSYISTSSKASGASSTSSRSNAEIISKSDLVKSLKKNKASTSMEDGTMESKSIIPPLRLESFVHEDTNDFSDRSNFSGKLDNQPDEADIYSTSRNDIQRPVNRLENDISRPDTGLTTSTLDSRFSKDSSADSSYSGRLSTERSYTDISDFSDESHSDWTSPRSYGSALSSGRSAEYLLEPLTQRSDNSFSSFGRRSRSSVRSFDEEDQKDFNDGDNEILSSRSDFYSDNDSENISHQNDDDTDSILSGRSFSSIPPSSRNSGEYKSFSRNSEGSISSRSARSSATYSSSGSEGNFSDREDQPFRGQLSSTLTQQALAEHNQKSFRTYTQRKRTEIQRLISPLSRPGTGESNYTRDSTFTYDSSLAYTSTRSGSSHSYRSSSSARSYSTRSYNTSESNSTRSSFSAYSSNYSPRSHSSGSLSNRSYDSEISRGVSETPRSQLPGGDDFERLPTDRSDFSKTSLASSKSSARVGKSLASRLERSLSLSKNDDNQDRDIHLPMISKKTV